MIVAQVTNCPNCYGRFHERCEVGAAVISMEAVAVFYDGRCQDCGAHASIETYQLIKPGNNEGNPC